MIPRILGWRWLYGTMGIVGNVALGISAWRGSTFALVVLVALSCAWIALAVSNGVGWKRTLASWHETLTWSQENLNLLNDTTGLLEEALVNLATYDDDAAIDIGKRMNTITALRMRALREET